MGKDTSSLKLVLNIAVQIIPRQEKSDKVTKQHKTIYKYHLDFVLQ